MIIFVGDFRTPHLKAEGRIGLVVFLSASMMLVQFMCTLWQLLGGFLPLIWIGARSLHGRFDYFQTPFSAVISNGNYQSIFSSVFFVFYCRAHVR